MFYNGILTDRYTYSRAPESRLAVMAELGRVSAEVTRRDPIHRSLFIYSLIGIF
jgi:hypothetical protein